MKMNFHKSVQLIGRSAIQENPAHLTQGELVQKQAGYVPLYNPASVIVVFLFMRRTKTLFHVIYHLDVALKMESVRPSETLVSTYESTRRYNPEDQHRQVS
jgi:hypothetical protein